MTWVLKSRVYSGVDNAALWVSKMLFPLRRILRNAAVTIEQLHLVFNTDDFRAHLSYLNRVPSEASSSSDSNQGRMALQPPFRSKRKITQRSLQ
jgi:hypothetical protein